MSNAINYLSHTLTTPDYYLRNFENDLPPQQEVPEYIAIAERVGLAVLPFLSLYKPLGSIISCGMGGLRAFTNILEVIEAGKRGDLGAFIGHVVQVALAVLSVVTTIFQFTVGLLVSSAVDFVLSLIRFVEHIVNGRWEKAVEELLQMAGAALYIAIILTGNLEITLASFVIQLLLQGFQAWDEFKEGHILEGIAKVLMGAVRGFQVAKTSYSIYRRNELQKQFESLRSRIEEIWKVSALYNSPLHVNDQGEVILEDADGKKYNFGTHFHGFGKELVKGDNLTFRAKEIDGKNVTELDFKVNHVFREHLKDAIDDLVKLQGENLNEFLSLSKAHVKGIKVEKVPFELTEKFTAGSAYRITFDGLGSMVVGADSHVHTLYDRVIVRLDEGKNLYDLHEMLSFVDLSDTLQKSSSDDIERIKIGQLFRNFFPNVAFWTERSKEFFVLSPEEQKKIIVEYEPKMQGIFDEFLSKMEAREILPGRVRYAMPGLADVAKGCGAKGVAAAVIGCYTDEQLAHRVATILKMGMLSSEMRYSNGIAVKGMSTNSDFYSGGADSVFTQMLTVGHTNLDDLWYHSKAHLIVSLDALEMGTYQYYFDEFGIRYGETYRNRPSIIDFIPSEKMPNHEVMFKERIDPSLIIGIMVPTESDRDQLLSRLRSYNVITPDDFIKVGNILK